MRLTSQTSYLIMCGNSTYLSQSHCLIQNLLEGKYNLMVSHMILLILDVIYFPIVRIIIGTLLTRRLWCYHLFMHVVEYAGGLCSLLFCYIPGIPTFLQHLCMFIRFSSRCILELTITEQQKSVLTGSRFHYVHCKKGIVMMTNCLLFRIQMSEQKSLLCGG